MTECRTKKFEESPPDGHQALPHKILIALDGEQDSDIDNPGEEDDDNSDFEPPSPLPLEQTPSTSASNKIPGYTMTSKSGFYSNN